MMRFAPQIVTPLEVPVSLDLSKFYHTSKDPNEEKFIDEAASIQNIKSSEKDDDLTYTLSAVVIHQGALDYGHYYSLCRSSASDGTGWVRLNDHIVSEVTESSVLLEARGGVVDNAATVSASSNAYILFYVRNIK
jgi:ubiquitin C-terminal hydrolase